MQLFVKAVEIWQPDAVGSALALTSSYYAEIKEFKSISEKMTFYYGEGLPGKTWATGEPVVLTDIESSDFLRSEPARQAGIACAIALPIMAGEFLQAVVVILCGSGSDLVGTVEIWKNKNHSTTELKLADGYFGELDRFEWLSRRLTMMHGFGLPGTAWSEGKPIIMDDLAHSSSFMRARNAGHAGLTTGVAVPFHFRDRDISVLVFLSAEGSPIARRFEVWVRDKENDTLRFDAGQSHSGIDLKAKYGDTRIRKGQGSLGQVWLTGKPQVAEFQGKDANAMVILPVIENGQLNSVVCLVL